MRLAILSSFSFALVGVMAGLTFWVLNRQEEPISNASRPSKPKKMLVGVKLLQGAENQPDAALQAQKFAKTEKEKAYTKITLIPSPWLKHGNCFSLHRKRIVTGSGAA